MSGYHNIVGDAEGSSDFYFMNYLTDASKIRPHFNGAGIVSLDSQATLIPGNTYYVVTTWDKTAGVGSIYINGRLDNSLAVGSGSAVNTNNPVYIGRDNREPGGDFTIDEVAYYDDPLSATAIHQRRALAALGVPVPDSLVHFWNFDEAASGTGTAENLYGTANHGSFLGGATRTAGLVGTGAAQFNGTNGDAVGVGPENFSFTTGLTVETVFTTDWDGTTFSEFFRKEDSSNRILLSFQPGSGINGSDSPGISFGIYVGSYGELDVPLDGLDGRPTLADVADGEMHHLVATYDSTTGEKAIYLDGVLLDSVTVTPGTLIASGGGALATIGAHGGGEPFNGVLDEVAIYSAALSAEQIGSHYERVSTGFTYFSVPEPNTFMLAGLGLVALLSCGRRRRRS